MVRFATEKDLRFLKHAWDVCFHDPVEFIDWNFAENFSQDNTLIAEVEGVPASNMQLVPHRISLRGKEYDINYVSGVATLPEYRNRGLVRELFRFGFPEMVRRNQPFSLLVPFNYAFYEKFGYKQCYNKTFRYLDAPPQVAFCPKISLELIQDLNRIYRTEMEHRTGYVLRSFETWRRILMDLLRISKGLLCFHETEGVRDGYALMSPATDGHGWEIHEMLGNCSLSCREEEKPFAMARIVDAKRMLMDLAKDFPGQVRLKIQDEQILMNNLIIRIGNGTVTPCQEYDFALDIKDLAELVFGFCEDITGTGLFAKTNTYLNLIF